MRRQRRYTSHPLQIYPLGGQDSETKTFYSPPPSPPSEIPVRWPTQRDNYVISPLQNTSKMTGTERRQRCCPPPPPPPPFQKYRLGTCGRDCEETKTLYIPLSEISARRPRQRDIDVMPLLQKYTARWPTQRGDEDVMTPPPPHPPFRSTG